MKFTAALFGHYKPRYYLMDRQTNTIIDQLVDDPGDFSKDERFYVHQVQGWERRAEPGDIIDIMPIDHPWSELEKKHFLIVEIDGFDDRHIDGLREPYWDTSTYEKYSPLAEVDWYTLMNAKSGASSDPTKALSLLDTNRTAWYLAYLEATKDRCRYPRQHLKKRRMNLKLDDLETLKVDLELMLDMRVEYKPDVVIPREACNDKLNDRYISTTDNIALIRPLADAELKV